MCKPLLCSGAARYGQRLGGSRILAVLAVVALWLPATQAATYKTNPPKIDGRAARTTLLPVVNRVLTTPSAFQNQDDRAKFDQYFLEYFFPSLTLDTPEALTDLGSDTKGFLSRNLGRASYQEVRDYLTQMAFGQMKAVATDNYHPAVRYNAMLLIGQLDEKPGDPPVPLPAALDFMLEQLAADSSAAPGIVKVGALIGIDRHLRAGIPEDKKTAVSDALVAIARADKPTDRSQEGHDWIRATAAEILAQQGQLGNNQSVHQVLVELVGDDAMALGGRMRVAQAWVALKDVYKPDAGVDVKAAVAALAKYAQAVFEHEAEEAKEFTEREISGLNFDVFGEEPIGYPRGRLIERIDSILGALATIEGAMDPQLRARVTALKQPLDALRDLSADKKEVDLKITKMIEDVAAQTVKPQAESLITGEAPVPVEEDVPEL